MVTDVENTRERIKAAITDIHVNVIVIRTGEEIDDLEILKEESQRRCRKIERTEQDYLSQMWSKEKLVGRKVHRDRTTTGKI